MYQFQFEYDFQDLLTLNRVYEKVYRRWIGPLRIFNIVIGVILWLEAVAVMSFLSALEWGGTTYLVTAVVFMLLGTLFLTGWYWRPRLNAWSSKRLLVKNSGELTVSLEEDGVRDSCKKGESFHPWDAFISSFHSRGRYLLFIDKRHAIILPERAMIQGDSTVLRAFLEAKLQKKVKEIP